MASAAKAKEWLLHPQNLWMAMLVLLVAFCIYKPVAAMILLLVVLTAAPGPTGELPRSICSVVFMSVVRVMVICEIVLYTMVRVMITLLEANLETNKDIKTELNQSTSYQEWYKHAENLDELEGRSIWRQRTPQGIMHHNWDLVNGLIENLQRAREQKDPILALVILQQSAARNVGGILSRSLYSRTNTGEPKQVVHDLVAEIEKTVDYLIESNRKRRESRPRGFGRRFSMKRKSLQGSYSSVYGHRASILAQSMRGLLDDARTAAEVQSIESDEISELGIEDEFDDNSTIATSASIFTSPTTAGKSVVQLEDPFMAEIHKKECFKVFKRIRAAYGRSALCLSGGGKNGASHVGIVKALLDEDMLPEIVAGTSAGSFTAAFVGTHTNEELRRDLTTANIIKHGRFGDFTTGVSNSQATVNYVSKGYVYTPYNIVDHVKWFTLGDLTFEEAHKRTGKVLNISVSPTTKNASPVLLNYVSAPDVVIFTAVLASAAIPGIFAPARLYVKDANGKVVPQGGDSAHQLYSDGSGTVDIPTSSLREMFNCTYFVTAQANPHIAPLCFNNHGDVAMPNVWQDVDDESPSLRGGFLLGAMEALLRGLILAKMTFTAWMNGSTPLSEIMRQTEECSVVMIAKQRFKTYLNLVRSPTAEEWPHLMQDGRIVAYRNIAMMKVNERINKALARGVTALRDVMGDDIY